MQFTKEEKTLQCISNEIVHWMLFQVLNTVHNASCLYFIKLNGFLQCTMCIPVDCGCSQCILFIFYKKKMVFCNVQCASQLTVAGLEKALSSITMRCTPEFPVARQCQFNSPTDWIRWLKFSSPHIVWIFL